MRNGMVSTGNVLYNSIGLETFLKLTKDKESDYLEDHIGEVKKHLQVLKAGVSMNPQLSRYQNDVEKIFETFTQEKNFLKTSELVEELVDDLEEDFRGADKKRKNGNQKEGDQNYT